MLTKVMMHFYKLMYVNTLILEKNSSLFVFFYYVPNCPCTNIHQFLIPEIIIDNMFIELYIEGHKLMIFYCDKFSILLNINTMTGN
jgi:hypothetical protein